MTAPKQEAIDVDSLGLGELLAELDFAELLDLAIALAPNDEYMDALDHDPPEPGLREILATLPAEAAMEHARYLINTRDICDQALEPWAWSTSEQVARGNLIANKLNQLQREHEGREHMSPKPETIEALTLEIERARDKFPSNAHLFLALVEEVGELSKDLLEGNPGWREEALQVACVALRLYEEGDPTTPRGKIEQEKELQRRRGCHVEGCVGIISRAVLGFQCFACGRMYDDEEVWGQGEEG